MIKLLAIIRIGGFLLLSFTVADAAEEVYKWTDSDGRVHYGDRPRTTDHETITIKNVPTFQEDVGQNNDRVQTRQRLLDIYQEERTQKEESRQAELAEKEKIKRECDLLKKQFKETSQARYLYHESDDPKNPIVLSNAQRQEETQRLRQIIGEK